MTACMLKYEMLCALDMSVHSTHIVYGVECPCRGFHIGHGFECSGTNCIALVCGNTTLHESVYMVLIWHCIWC